jgi:hypothetical protein
MYPRMREVKSLIYLLENEKRVFIKSLHRLYSQKLAA